MGSEYIIEMRDISKSFYGVKILHDITFKLRPGEIRGLLGENGAGKSTMMRILNGIYTKDSGQIFVNGEEKHFSLPRDARAAKIAFVHQEIALSANLTIAQNMFLGLEKTNGIFLDDEAMRDAAKRSLDALGLDLDVDTLVGTLSVAQQQMVEIAKALTQDASVLVLDEPTAALSEKEVQFLFKQMRRLKEKNVAIIFISHRLNEIEEITDTLTVLRDGTIITDGQPTKGLSSAEIIAMMVGRNVTQFFDGEKPRGTDEIVFEAKGLTNSKIKNVNFQLKRGEILGFGGLVGAGRTEVMRAIFGLDPLDKGELILHGKPIVNKNPKQAIQHRFGFVSEDRKLNGLILVHSIARNLTMNVTSTFIKGIHYDKAKEKAIVDEYGNKLSIKMTSMNQLCQYLSGGNQQKVVISKWLASGADVLIMDEPTRGVDVGAKSEIYRLMHTLAGEGLSIIMVSSELPELINISSRIAVMHEGELNKIFEYDELKQYNSDDLQKEIMFYATGERK